jgi:hypothetical protein
MQLEVRRIRSGDFRDRPGDMVWLEFMAPHRHLIIVVVSVSNARTNTNVPRIGAHLPLPGSIALGAQYGKLLLCLARLRFRRSMPIIPSLWRMGDGWHLWWLSWLIAWLFWWRFVASLAWVLLTLVFSVVTVMS